MAVHDQRFKRLLQEFFPEFLTLFFPAYAALLDFSAIEWLDKEQIFDPPRAEALEVDLLARLRQKGPPDAGAETIAVVHIEVESRDAVAEFPRRMYEYYQPLWGKFNGRVLPIALYLRVGRDGIGVETYLETFGPLEVVRFQYLYVGLPALDAETYLRGDNWLGVALAALMRMPRDRRPYLRADALRQVLVECKESDRRRWLLAECIEAYLMLDQEQESVFLEIVKKEPYVDLLPTMLTTFEKGELQGRAKGREEGRDEGRDEGLREAIQRLLERRFGPASPAVLQRLEGWPSENLMQLLDVVSDAPSLQALGMAD